MRSNFCAKKLTITFLISWKTFFFKYSCKDHLAKITNNCLKKKNTQSDGLYKYVEGHTLSSLIDINFAIRLPKHTTPRLYVCVRIFAAVGGIIKVCLGGPDAIRALNVGVSEMLLLIRIRVRFLFLVGLFLCIFCCCDYVVVVIWGNSTMPLCDKISRPLQFADKLASALFFSLLVSQILWVFCFSVFD